MQVCCSELKVLEAHKEFDNNKTTNNSHLCFLHQGQPERERKQLLSLEICRFSSAYHPQQCHLDYRVITVPKCNVGLSQSSKDNP